MADLEAAARAPPPAVSAALAPPPPAPRTAAACAKAALGDAIIYSFLGAMFVACAASIALIAARYTVGGGYPYAYAAVAAVARHVFLLAFLAMEMLCPFTILVLVLRLARRQPELPEELLMIEGVYVTVQIHGLEHPGGRGGRQGIGYGLMPLLVFVVFSMFMLLGLVMQERWPATAKKCCAQTTEEAVFSDIGSFSCSVMVIFTFIPHVLIQLRNMPR